MFRYGFRTRQLTATTAAPIPTSRTSLVCPGLKPAMVAILTIGCIALLAAPTALAVPACPEPFALKQPDGTTVTARHGGDERFGWISVAGQLVEKGPDGFWRYLLADDGKARLSAARAGLDAAPARTATVADAPALARAALSAARPAARPAASPKTPGSGVTLNPTEPLLVIDHQCCYQHALHLRLEGVSLVGGDGMPVP